MDAKLRRRTPDWIARLAVDVHYQGKGVGKIVLFTVLEYLARASQAIGFEVVVVDALESIREAASAQQQDVTSFVLGAAMERARAILVEERLLQLTPTEVAQIDAALDEEPRVIPELARLIRDVRGRQLSAAEKTVSES